MLVSNEILFEYREVIDRRRRIPWVDYQAMLTTLATLGALEEVSPQFRFNVIDRDPDDNKFCDCAIAGEADYILTYDRHLNSLAKSGYKAQPITPEEFALLI